MNATNLKAWLPFNESETLDLCNNTWAATGNVSLDTTITKFGSASVHLPSGAYLSANNVIDLNADKWTFDAWAYCVSSSDDDGFLALSEGANRRGITAANDGVYVASSGGGSWQTKNTSLLFPSVKNQWVHLAIVKNGTDVTFYQDGVSVWSFTTSGLNNNGVFILGGCSYGYGNDIYFDEVRFWEGDALWTANFTPPTAADYASMIVSYTTTFDVEMRYTNRTDGNYWRYENPGSGDYIYYHDNITTEEVGYDKSVTGVAFWGGDSNDMFNTPAGIKEVWMRFDVWIAYQVWRLSERALSIGAYSATLGSTVGIRDYDMWAGEWRISTESQRALTVPPDTLTPVLLYMLSDATNGVIQLTVGNDTHTYRGAVNNGEDFSNLHIYTNYPPAYQVWFSNVVISNAPLTLEDGWHREPVAVEMNIKAPDLCVRKNGRTYVIPFSTTNSPPAGSVVAKVGGKTVYNPLVATDDENASPLRTRCNGRDRAFSASFG